MLCSKVCTSGFSSWQIRRIGNECTEKQRHASTHAAMITEDKQCTDTSCLPFRHHRERKEKFVKYSFDEWGGGSVHPSEHMHQCSRSEVTAQPQCASSSIGSGPLWIPRKPPTICTHTSMHTRMAHSLYKLHCSSGAVVAAASAETACLHAASVCLSLTLTLHTGRTHVFLHGAASAHPPSPRIGRTLQPSLGELTGGAGLQERGSALDSYTVPSRR